ncbi:hypothetical protein GIB67_015893 [Kingdonia uniflora]|uniref:Uncharacterized protein n=1 Tax=Kingdonia uniflora TaxID=39325 RepID=A0A7J7NGS1_9MAGN|nr:hypothetical protein GIB67_015893 [Kingdonia uniflora]
MVAQENHPVYFDFGLGSDPGIVQLNSSRMQNAQYPVQIRSIDRTNQTLAASEHLKMAWITLSEAIHHSAIKSLHSKGEFEFPDQSFKRICSVMWLQNRSMLDVTREVQTEEKD